MTDVPYTLVHQPGVYGIDEDSYHAHTDALSASGAKLLLPPSCPAKFRYAQTQTAKPKRAFDVGHAAHTLRLGIGKPLVEVIGTGKDPEAWSTNETKAQVKAVRDAGSIPLHTSDYEAVHQMAQALADNKKVCRLFEDGLPEQSLFAQITDAVMGRGRLDWLPPTPLTSRMIVPDYKSASDASPEAFSKAAASFGYHRQAAWYLRLLAALGISNDAVFVFVVQEVTPPYLCAIHQLDDDAMLIGDHEMSQAVDIYTKCSETGDWYGFDREVSLVSLPSWKTYGHEALQ